ncbi:MAG: M23 family metallopeptidase [Spirochaetes bacterium]|nr:M23 family metallopeptidase [Spirochaetota bacterium]
MKKILLCLFLPAITYSGVKSPSDYNYNHVEKITVEDDVISANLYVRNFSQGELAYLEILSSSNISNIKAQFGNYETVLTPAKWGYRCFIPFAPDEKTGKREITVSYNYRDRFSITHIFFDIETKKYQTLKRSLDVGSFSKVGGKPDPERAQFIKDCQEKKNKAFASRENDLIDSNLSHPRDAHYLTSYFWEKRRYQRYKIIKRKRVYENSKESIHRGVDLKGPLGTPVFAIAKGKVVLSGKMHYEGNMVIIDHGNLFFTYYMHMDKLLAKEGQIIEAGTQIGEVGSTGISTGPHLHVSAIIDKIQFDPLSILHLPIKDLNK